MSHKLLLIGKRSLTKMLKHADCIYYGPLTYCEQLAFFARSQYYSATASAEMTGEQAQKA